MLKILKKSIDYKSVFVKLGKGKTNWFCEN